MGDFARAFGALLLVYGCSAELPNPHVEAPPSESVDEASSTRLVVSSDSLEGVALLALVNDPAITQSLLDHEIGLDRRAAVGIVLARPFARVSELDAVPYVGERALQRLLAYAYDHDYVPKGPEMLGVFEGVSFTVAEAAVALDLVNHSNSRHLDVDVRLDARAVAALMELRPIDTVAELAAVRFIGPAALRRIKAFSTVF